MLMATLSVHVCDDSASLLRPAAAPLPLVAPRSSLLLLLRFSSACFACCFAAAGASRLAALTSVFTSRTRARLARQSRD